MSHLISHTLQLRQQPAVPPKLRKVTFHPTHFSQQRLSQWNQEHQQRQLLFLNSIAKKFARYQQQRIEEQSHQDAQGQLLRLKRRLKRTLEKENIKRIMGEKQSKDQHMLDAVIRNNTEFVDIGQKYARKIQLKLSAFNEINRIQHQKQDYKIWYSRCRNDPQHSLIANQLSRIIPSPKQSHSVRNTLDEKMLSNSHSTYQKKRRNLGEGNIKQ